MSNESDRKKMRQSIRLQIDLPIRSHGDDQYDYTSEHEQDMDEPINKICLQISFDTVNGKRNTSRHTILAPTPKKTAVVTTSSGKSALKVKTSSSSSTSGYSSSSSCTSINSNDFYDYRQSDQAFLYQNDDSRANSMNSLFCNDETENNIYDKLNYNSKRRFSLSSTSSSASYTSTFHEHPFSHTEEENIYEEISNFFETSNKQLIDSYTSSKNKCSYESLNTCVSSSTSSIKRINTNREQLNTPKVVNTKSTAFRRREYTVNEIFQNLNNFKEDAIKNESKITKSVSNNPSSKSVQQLKQLFEKKPLVPKQQHPKQQHIYVNEKISN